MAMSPRTPSTRAANSGVRLRDSNVTAKVHATMIQAQSSSEPSWAPQTAAIR